MLRLRNPFVWETVIQLRDLPDQVVLEEVRRMFKEAKGDIYYSDIIDELCVGLEQVVRICNQLTESGEVGVSDEVGEPPCEEVDH